CAGRAGRAARTRRARGERAVRARSAGHHRRIALAGLSYRRSAAPGQGGQGTCPDLHSASWRVRGQRRVRAGGRHQGAAAAPGGDVINASVGPSPRVGVAEGDYRAIARNDNKTYEGEFRVVNGVDREVEIIAR